MAIGLVQTVTANISGSSVSGTLSGVGAGNLIVAQLSYYRGGNTSTPGTPSDTNGTMVAAVVPNALVLSGTDATGCAMWYEQNAASGNHTISVTLTSGGSGRLTLTEWSGIAASALDQETHNESTAGGNTSQDTGTTSATSQANELVMVALNVTGSPGAANIGIPSPPITGFTSLQVGQNDASDIGFSHAYKTISATGTQTATFTWSDATTNSSQAAIATFKASSSINTTITPGQGALALAGLAVVMSLGMTPSTGSASFQGYAPTVSMTSPKIAPTPGSASFAGLAPTLNLTMTPTQGALSFAGQAPSFSVSSSRTITPGSATLNFAGASVNQAWTDVTGVGGGAFQGYAPSVSINGPGSGSITPQQADMAFVGYAVTQILTLPPSPPGVLSFQGYAPTVNGQTILTPNTGAASFQGYAPILGFPTQAGSLSFQGQAPTLAFTMVGSTPSNLAFQGYAPSVTYSGLTTPGTLSFQGYAPTVSNQIILTPTTGTLSFGGNLPTVSFLSTGVGAANWTGYAPTVTNSGQHVVTPRHFMQRFPVGTDGTVQCVDFTRAVAPFVFWQENKIDANGFLVIVVDGIPTGWDDGLQVNAQECIIVTKNPVQPVSWTDGLQIDARGFLIVTETPTLPVFNMQGLQFDVNGYLVVTIS